MIVPVQGVSSEGSSPSWLEVMEPGSKIVFSQRAVSVVKYLLVMSALVAAFDRINADHTLVEARTIEKSRSYKPLLRLSESLFPFLEWVGEQVPQLDAKDSDGESL